MAARRQTPRRTARAPPPPARATDAMRQCPIQTVLLFTEHACYCSAARFLLLGNGNNLTSSSIHKSVQAMFICESRHHFKCSLSSSTSTFKALIIEGGSIRNTSTAMSPVTKIQRFLQAFLCFMSVKLLMFNISTTLYFKQYLIKYCVFYILTVHGL